MPALCRICYCEFDTDGRCPSCHSPRIIAHPELFDLSVAHMDCDAFYASVEKRDNPALKDKPVIIGGGKRGVVSTACYIARIKGVRSAMPMFQALKLCPEGVVIRPRLDVYQQVSYQVRQMMQALTPAVEPLSLDEAFLDLSGTELLHKASPASILARFIREMEREIGISGSIGLSHNKFLAKVASDLDKPRGFSVIGKAETEDFLRDKSVRLIFGVGNVLQKSLHEAGIRRIGDLRRWEKSALVARFGHSGERLWHLARGRDKSRIKAERVIKSISHEVTFSEDTLDRDVLDGHIWRLSEKVSDRAKARGLSGQVVVLKLKRSDHKLLTRRVTLPEPTQMADSLYRAVCGVFGQLEEKNSFRLIGVGLSELGAACEGDLTADLLDKAFEKKIQVERVRDKIKNRFGKDAIKKGRALR